MNCRKSLILEVAAVAVLYLFAMSMVVIGVDYGEQWDEMPHKVALMADSLKRGPLLPGDYEYPSLWYDIAVLSLAPDFLRGAAKRDLRDQDAYGFVLDGQSYLKEKFTQREFIKSYLFRNRIIFAALSLAAMFAVYLMARYGAGDRLAALAAAALCAGSFEYFYHAKFFAPDSILAAFAALSGAVLAFPAAAKRPGVIYLATFAAGLACGAKYPAGAFLFSPLVFALFFTPGYDAKEKIRIALCCLGVFTVSFLLTTPGAVIDPVRFVHDIQYQVNHYKTVGHGPSTIHAGGEHLAKMGEYFALFALSPFKPEAIALFGLAVLGLAASAVKKRGRILALSAAPVLYILFFAGQRVMIVRNYMAVIPFLALWAGLGVSDLFAVLGRRSKAAAWILTALLSACVTANFAWIALTSYEVAASARIDLAASLNAYLADRPDKIFYVSPSLRALVKDRPNVTGDREAKVDGLIYHLRDDEGRRLRNKPDLVLDVIGPDDVNMDYYNDWIGLDRILVYNPKYRQSSLPYRSVPRQVSPNSPWNADYALLFFENGLEITFDGPVHAKSLDVSLAKDAQYRFDLYSGDVALASVSVSSPARLRLDDDNLANMTVSLPPEAAGPGFTRLRIVPVGGGGQYSLGHLRLGD
jgi:hypothetical protein